MGRTIPSSSSTTTPPPSLPLLAAAIAASFAVLFTVCITHHRKSTANSLKSQPSSLTSSEYNKESSLLSSSSPPTPPPQKPTQPTLLVEEYTTPHQEDNSEKTTTNNNVADTLALSTSSPRKQRKLLVSLSMRFPEGLAKIRTGKKEKEKQKVMSARAAGEESAEHKAAYEESVWMKTIILGERCRVPSSDEEDEIAIVRNKMGKKMRNYHPRTPRSLPVSITNSFAVADTGV